MDSYTLFCYTLCLIAAINMMLQLPNTKIIRKSFFRPIFDVFERGIIYIHIHERTEHDIHFTLNVSRRQKSVV